MTEVPQPRVILLLAGLPVAAAWVAMTVATGKTYHLAPLLTAAAPGFLSRATGRPAGVVAAVAGLVTNALAWTVIVTAGIEPPWTLTPHQPGGVRLEVVAFTALGLALGAGRGPLWLARSLRTGVRQRSVGRSG